VNDQERADRLARAIDDLLAGRPAGDLDEEALNELLGIARIRLDLARSSLHASAQHEASVWEQVLTRLDGLETESDENTAVMDSLENAGDLAVRDSDLEELQDVVRLRKAIADSNAALAESDRDVVWQQIAARIEARRQHRGVFSVLRRSNPEAETLAAALDDLLQQGTVRKSRDTRLDDLVKIAGTRRAAASAAAEASKEAQQRVWARIRPRLLARVFGTLRPDRGTAGAAGTRWPKLAAIGATAAIVLAAIGPIPATGLANHPVVQIVDFVGDQVGVSETSAPPPIDRSDGEGTSGGAIDVVEGSDITTAEASKLLGLPLQEPTSPPTGFELVSSRFFDEPLTATAGGVLLLAYSQTTAADDADQATILIYQEQAGGDDVAVYRGYASSVLLSDDTEGTYVEGSWRASSDGLLWGDDAAQTLIFDRWGVRTIIHYVDGPPIHASSLLAIADSLAAPVP
jgi:hypothetical protein